MISFEKAQEKLHSLALTHKKSLHQHEVNLDQACSQVSSKNIYAEEYHPAFNNSSMDGFAIKAQDSVGASLAEPSSLTIVGESSAGKPWDHTLQPNHACRIMTGAKVPKGSDAVIKVEDVEEVDGKIQLRQSTLPNTNIRSKGEDLKPGDLLVAKGTRLTAEDIMLLASQGKNRLKVSQAIRVAIISTGQEILEHDANAPQPALGEIRNSTGPFLRSKLMHLPCEIVSQVSCSDHPEELFSQISKALDLGSDIIISTGGVSAGKYDLIPGMVSDLRGTILFHKVSMKPGKPILVANFSKKKPCTFFGLPGNPISTLVGFNFFVETYLRHLTEQARLKPVKAFLNQEISTPRGLTTLLRSRVEVSDDALLTAEVCQGQGSHMMTSLKAYNAWLKIDKGHDVVKKGSFVDAYLLGQDHSFLF